MIAMDNEYLQEASNALYDLNADFNVRERCRNREEYYNVLRTFRSELDITKDRLAQANNELAQKDLEIKKLQAELARMKSSQ